MVLQTFILLSKLLYLLIFLVELIQEKKKRLEKQLHTFFISNLNLDLEATKM